MHYVEDSDEFYLANLLLGLTPLHTFALIFFHRCCLSWDHTKSCVTATCVCLEFLQVFCFKIFLLSMSVENIEAINWVNGFGLSHARPCPLAILLHSTEYALIQLHGYTFLSLSLAPFAIKWVHISLSATTWVHMSFSLRYYMSTHVFLSLCCYMDTPVCLSLSSFAITLVHMPLSLFAVTWAHMSFSAVSWVHMFLFAIAWVPLCQTAISWVHSYIDSQTSNVTSIYVHLCCYLSTLIPLPFTPLSLSGYIDLCIVMITPLPYPCYYFQS